MSETEKIIPVQDPVPADFFLEEERNGYKVSASMKKVWAVELEMLQELLRLCRKHGLTVWAEGGTMLGAVRHGGFIPWDDDIDLAMPREDYDRLQEIAPKELRKPFFFQTIHTDPGFTHRHAQIRNSETATYHEGQTSYTCNSGIFIDIFPLDSMPASPRAFKRHYNQISGLKRRLRFTQRLLSGCPALYRFCRKHVPALSDERIFSRFEEVLRSVKPYRSAGWVDITFNHASPLRPIVSYRETVNLKFEFMEIPVPKGYDTILTIQYGDYMTPVKAPTCHGTLLYDTQRSYRDILKKK